MFDKQLRFIISAVDKATWPIRWVGKSLQWLNNWLKSMKPAFDAIATYGAVAFWAVSTWLVYAVNEAWKLESAMKWLESIVNWVGENFGNAQTFLTSFTADWLVPMNNAATALKNLLASWFSLDEATVLMDRFKDSASFGRQASLSLWDAVQSATEGIKNQNSILVDNAWVTKNISIMQEEYAKSIWKTVTQLTDAESREAVYQWILKETTFQVWDAAKASEWYQWQIAKLNSLKVKLAQTIGTMLLPIVWDLTKELNDNLQKIIEDKQAMDNIKVTINWLVSILKFLRNWLVKVTEWWWMIFDIIVPVAFQIVEAIKSISKAVVEAWRSIVSFISNAKQRWSNMIDMFVEWIKAKIQSVRDAANSVATTISNFLWFHSPTKEWPASDSDKWMPNFINMLTVWLNDWALKVAIASHKISKAIKDWLGQEISSEKLKEIFSSIQNEAKTAFDALWSNIENQKGKIQSLKDSILWIKQSLEEVTSSISQNRASWQWDIASRAVEIQKKLNQQNPDWTYAISLEERQKLYERLALAKSMVSDEQIRQAEALLSRNETQVIIDRMLARENELKDKKRILIEELNAKKEQLVQENNIYAELVNQKKLLDTEYFNFFWSKIAIQQKSIQDTIRMIQTLRSLSWWSTVVQESQISSSKQPTTSWWSNININLWWVTVNNEADENRLVQKIKEAFIRDTQLYNYWVS